MNRRLLRIQILSLVFISLMLISWVPQVAWAGQALQQEEELFPKPFEGYNLDSIYIFYDPTDDLLIAVADAVQEIATFRINGIKMIPVYSYSDLKYNLADKPWIAIYALHSDLMCVDFSDVSLSWSEFYQLLSTYQETQHVLGMGNTLSFAPELTENDVNMHHSNVEQIDGLLLILYDVWALADIIEQRAPINSQYDNAAKDIRSMAIKLYGDNLNEFFKRTLEPVDPIGQEDPVALAERTQSMWDEHKPTLKPAAYIMADDGSLEEVPLDDLPEGFAPMIKLSSPAELAEDDFSLGQIPLFSALNGPIGDIIDILLDVLAGEGQTEISIPSDVVDTLMSVFEIIEPIVGIVSDFDLDSPLKSVINALASEFPFIAEFKDYLNIILKALFALRGDLSDILDVVWELVKALLPDVIPSSISDFLFNLLGVEDGLWDMISDVVSEGKGIYDSIFGFFTKNGLEAILNKTLAATLDLDTNQVSTLLPRLVSFVSAAIDFLTSNDYVKFIQEVGTDLLNSLITTTGLENAISNIMDLFEIALTAVEVVDNYDASSIMDLVIKVLNSFIPSGMIATAEDFAKYLLDAVKTAKETASTDLAGFQSQLLTIINNNVSGAVTANQKSLIVDTISLLAGFYNDGFDKNALPDLFDIANGIITEFGLAHGGSATLAQINNLQDAINEVVRPIMGVIAMVTDSSALKNMVSKTAANFQSELGSLPNMIMNAIEAMDIEDVLDTLPDIQSILTTVSEMSGGIINMIQFAKGQSFQGIMQSLLMSAGAILGTFPEFDDVPLDPVLDLLQQFFPKAFGLDPQNMPSVMETVNEIISIFEPYLGGIIDASTLRELLDFLMEVKSIFTDGVKWLVGKIFDWLGGLLNPLFDDLENMIEGIFAGASDLLGYSTTLPIGLGDWSLFDLTIALGIRLEFNIDLTPLFDMISSMIFDARQTLSLSSVGDFFKVIFSFFEITPQFYAELGVKGFDSSKNAIMGTLLKSFGLELSFEGSAHFVLNLFTFRNGMFEWENFMRIVEWGLHIKITLGKVFTLADLFTAGLGGGALGAVMEFLGLDTIKITIWLAVELDIVKKAATAIASEVSTMTLAITFGISIHIPIDLLIVAIIIDGSMEIILTFFQDFASADPMKITMRLIFTVKVKFRFLWFDDSSTWTWEPGGPWDLSPHKNDDEYAKSGVGFDSDDDGLSDEYEKAIPGLDWQKPDTDNDGANDKLEVQTMGTDPIVPDTDGDGLLDGEEWDLGTNPMREDTDWDDITDFEEVRIYGTDPFTQDTDGDHLTDAYEIYTRWDMATVTPTVEYVTIGGVKYDDHTDPLNPDTDGDGLLDGQEGPGGAYYGLDSLYNDTEGSGFDPAPLIFNYGYTHPLDADTDDDSWLQLYNGDIDMMLEKKLYPAGTEGQEYPMNDGAEVAGFDIILYDDEGEPYEKHVYTNPCNPDTDGDTGVTEAERVVPPAGAWLNSDGYELAQDPPSDPTDGDSDDDGLIDGLEGVLRQDSNHTFYLDADTDDDGLPDMMDVLLGTDPLSADTDLDMVSDGDEFYLYGTSPTVADSDFDGLSDGEELYFWHSNPMADDSDGDHLLDGFEVLVTGSDPMDEDSDNDGLTDFEEFFIYFTDAFVWDTDGDGLSDGQEILTYETDPLNWDTDQDSIWEPNEYGEMTWPMSDYQEVMIWGTNATGPDSDMDGLDDSMELYLGGWTLYMPTAPYPVAPWLDPIPLDPLNRDTDGDWLADGSELVLENVSGLIYPYRAITVVYRYNTSPVNADCDGDLLTDYQEAIVFNSDPQNNDTDNDSLDDWWEIWVYNTSAIHDDTDGDGLLDNEEVTLEIWPYGSWPPTNWSIGIGEGDNGTPGGWVPFVTADLPMPERPVLSATYETNALDPDSDNDFLPDGAEVYFYGSDPMDQDSDNDGIADTYEFDTDFDGLPDGLEFNIGLQGTFGGGIMNPDSDLDGLLDGSEYYIYGTDPAKMDTDEDGYSDGLEIALGLDPLTFTSEHDFELALAIARGRSTLRILLPTATEQVYQDSQVMVANFTPFQDVWFRYNNGTDWSSDMYLTYNSASGLWSSSGHSWPTGNITLEVYARNATGVVHGAVIWFIVNPGTTPFPWLLLGLAGAAVASVLIVGFVGYKRGFWSKLYYKIRPSKKPPEGTEKKVKKKKDDDSPGDAVETEEKPAKSSASEEKAKTASKKKTSKGGSSKGKMTALFGLLVIFIMGVTLFSAIPTAPVIADLGNRNNTLDIDGLQDIDLDNFPNDVLNLLGEDTEPGIPSDEDIGLVLQNKENNYKTIFEPWKTKAAIHAIAYHEPTGFLALGGGYLYDNEVHIWRLNTETGNFDKVWDSGDSILRADVLSLAWGDTDLNDFLEVAAASADGFVYLFEQRHIYDPVTNTENMFDHVWTSPYSFRAFDVKIYDADKDYREDIIVGGWDGKVRCFEYDDHSGYPFAEEHWISFRQVWTSGDTIDGKIYTIAYGDTNFNGLPEIIAGTREGRVYVFENDGVHIMINGEPFPLINDNHYKLVWTSQNYTWRPIMDMEIGELDGTPGEEIALVAQGQGVFVLNWDEGLQRYDYKKIYRPWEAWQTAEEAPWRLDFWADSIVSANNVTFFLSNGTEIPEPIAYTYIGAGLFDPDAECYPYNTGLANASDGHYSYFRADMAPNATAVIDFGKDEEGTGSASAAWDIAIRFASPVSKNNIKIGVGQSATDFEDISSARMLTFMNYLYIDVDDALGNRQWDWFRYLNISVFNGALYLIDSIKLMQVYNQITTALTVAIGPLPQEFNLFGPPNEPNRLIIADVVGKFYAFDFNGASEEYDLVWDSAQDDFFTVGTNVWDMVYVGSETRIPIWLQGGVEYVANPTSGVYRHWAISDMEFWQISGSTYPHEFLVVDDQNDVSVFVPNGPDLNYDPTRSSYFNPIEVEVVSEIGPSVVMTIETAYLISGQTVAVAGVFDPTISTDILYGGGAGAQAADIFFFPRATITDSYETLNYPTMADLDVTGDIVVALANAKTVPRIEFVDWDGDFDLDMILSTGFLYYCENLGLAPDGWPRFRMVKGFFEYLNTAESMNDYWGQPETWDIDQDGDLDLTLSYDTRMGGTCYLNDGTMDLPVWTKTKALYSNTRPETNLKFNDYTNIRMAPLGWGLMQDWWYDFNSEMTTFQQTEYSMMAFKTDTNYLGIFWPVYTQSSSYIVATYPTVSRYEFAIQTEGGNNFGYHIMESWNTEADLEDWTLTVKTGDVDGDGKGEVIVGDYDNNIYIFEHMLNNTYKRALRSFDINHTEVSDSSPYMWEELEGISGNFSRVIWDHVSLIVAGSDLDGDGLSELVAAAGLQVYVFEDTGIDDTYRLAFVLDLRDNPYVDADDWEHVTEVTAIGEGHDIDLNDQNELVVAVGPFLFIYNIPFNTWTADHEYFMNSGTPEGRFYLIGNGAQEQFEKAWIQTMAFADLDEDGFREVIIGGKVNTTQMRQDGFLNIYEWTGASFIRVWAAPSEVTKWNAITSIVTDDQDYDSKQELIIGHTKGFDIWEWTGTDNDYNKVDIVTSSPNYPIVPLETTRFQGTELYSLSTRGDNDISYFCHLNDDMIMAFCQADRLYYKLYYTPTDTWSIYGLVVQGDYPGYGGGSVIYEAQPSLFLHNNGTIYLTWKSCISVSAVTYYDFWITKSSGGAAWSTPVRISSSSLHRNYPSIYSIGTSLGCVYMLDTVHRAYYRTSSAWGTWGVTGFAVPFKNSNSYYVQSCDIINIPSSSTMPGGGYALAISGRNGTLAKTDLDIFVAISNSSFIWTNSPMYQATSSYNNEVNPDLGILDAPERSLMVVYESVESPVEDQIQMSYSNSYMKWVQHEPLATFPPTMLRVEKGGGQVEYWYNQTIKAIAPIALCPSVVGLRGGGFMQTHTFDFFSRPGTPLSPATIRDGSIYDIMKYDENADLLYGINPSSRFTHFNIRSVVELNVGDTDGDARREVIAGFDDRVGVYELTHSNVGAEIMEHEEAWLSNKFPYDVTGVSVYDSNGNGFEEIAVSCERGEVFVFEIEDTGTDKIDLMYSEVLWSTDLGNPVGEPFGHSHGIVVFDLDGDGKDEIIRGETGGTIRAIDDDGTTLWANIDFTGAPFWLVVANLTPAGSPYVAVMRWDGNLTIIRGVDGVTSAHVQVASTWVGAVAIGDIQGTSDVEVVVTNIFNQVLALSVTGTVIWNVTVGVGSITVGNFTGRDHLDVVIGHSNGSLSFLYGNNGTVFYSQHTHMGNDLVIPAVADLNGDGIDDVITGDEHLWAVDPYNKSIIYNSTFLPPDDMLWLWVEDFDDDSQYEALFVTKNGVYYEEMTSGRCVWSYEPETEDILDAMLGNFVDGRLGVGIATDDGWLVAIDALTGVPVFFDYWSSFEYNEMAVGDFNGDGVDDLAGSDDSTGEVRAVTAIKPWVPVPPVAFEYWSLYWNQSVSGTSVTGIWTEDYDNDAVSEYLVSNENGIVQLFDPIYPALIWSVNLTFVVEDVRFADFNNDGTRDFLLLARQGGLTKVFGLNGVDGSLLSGIDEAPPDDSTEIRLIAVGDFNLGSTGMEYALVLTTNTNYTWIEFYDRNGNLYTSSSVDAPNLWPTEALVGDFAGPVGGRDDITVVGISGGNAGSHWIWEGDGTYNWSFTYSAGVFINDIDTGNYNGAGRDDYVTAFSNGVVWSWEPWLGILWAAGSSATVDSVTTVNLDMVGNDEIAVNFREVGIGVYLGSSLTGVWAYVAQTSMAKQIQFYDIDGNGVMDMTMLVHDKVVVVNTGTNAVLAAYDTGTGVSYVRIGNFDDTGPLDLMVFADSIIYCITNGAVSPPLLPLPATANLAGFYTIVTGTLLAVVPAIIGLGVLFWRRKEIKEHLRM
ncbi:MAG: hypothetical protein JW779_06410 [Candidatus Thorarchaeota archaeon]|nr:hypothetical protein [Candidatus Thorarchaeota archaeon]